MRQQLWILTRLAVFVVLSAPFLYFFCYADDRQRATIAFGFTIWGASFGLFTYLSQLQTKRLEKADDLFAQYLTDPDIKSGMSALRELSNASSPSLEESIHRKSIFDLMNFFELACSAVLINAADEGRLKEYMFLTITFTFEVATPFMLEMRRAKSNPIFFRSFEILAKRWKKHPLK